jgi:putative DNA primase/helicase
MIPDFIPPHSREAEIAVLGSIMVDNPQLARAQAILASSDFFSEPHRKIFEAMAKLGEKVVAIDPVTVKEELSRSDALELVGGYAYIASLLDGVPISANVEHYARIVKEESEKRRKVEEAVEVLSALPPSAGPDDDVARLLRDVGLQDLGSHTTLAAVETALRVLRTQLNAADPLRRAIVREGAVRAVAKAGISSPAAVVNAALGAQDMEPGSEGQGRTLVLSDPEPWPEQVDGADLLNDLVAILRRYIVLPPWGTVAIALWVILAHVHDAFEVSPYLLLKSPTKRAGKTKTFTILERLVPRPLPTANVSAAGLFRSIQKFKPTLLVDEADTFLFLNEELRGILNGGHTRATANVVRCSGDDFEPRCFSTWCPKAIALIGNLHGTLEDRSIAVPIRRKAPHEKTERLRLDRMDGNLEVLRRKAARWAHDHVEALRHAEATVPEELHDRAADNWRTLQAIANQCGGPWPDEARRAALILSGAGPEEDTSPAIQLLADLRAVFRDLTADRLSSKQVVQSLTAMEDRPWPEWRKGKPLTENQLAKLLKPFGVGPKVIRLKDGSTPRGYLLSDLKDAFARYLPSEPQHPQQVNDDKDFGSLSTRNKNPCSAPSESAQKACQMEIVAPVAPSRADLPEINGIRMAPAVTGDEDWVEI